MNKIVLDYEPRSWAKEFHDTTMRYIVLVLHRRAGKTTASLNHLIRDSLNIKYKDMRFAYIAPTYRFAKDVAWTMLKTYCRPIPQIKFNESELKVTMPTTNCTITLYGADNPDSLRGRGFKGVVFDEYSQQPSNIYTEIIRPTLVDHEGYAIWLGTPKGKNEFYRMYQTALKSKRHLALCKSVEDTKLIKASELEDAKLTMSLDEYNQEFNCSFEASIKGAYYANEIEVARSQERFKDFKWEREMPVYTVWDLGVSDATSIGFIQKVGNEVRVIDYVEDTGKGLDHYTKLVRNKFYTYAKHYAPHDIKVRELSTGKSRLEIAYDLGIEFEIVPKMSVSERINAARMMFSRVWINTKNSQKLIDALSHYRKEWDERAGQFKDKPLHDWTSHAADMFGYAALVEKDFGEKVINYKQPEYVPISEYEGSTYTDPTKKYHPFPTEQEMARW